MPLSIGQNAPSFALASTQGNTQVLPDPLNKEPYVIYFYPKDFTPGCTAEACDFKDGFGQFSGLGIKVFGISRDSIESHLSFKKEHDLPFDLLSDPTGSVCNLYDALVPVLRIPKRITYLIDKQGKIAAVYENFFGASGHIKAMLEQISKK